MKEDVNAILLQKLRHSRVQWLFNLVLLAPHLTHILLVLQLLLLVPVLVPQPHVRLLLLKYPIPVLIQPLHLQTLVLVLQNLVQLVPLLYVSLYLVYHPLYYVYFQLPPLYPVLEFLRFKVEQRFKPVFYHVFRSLAS